MVQPWRNGDVILEWKPLEKFHAEEGAVVLRRWKSRESGQWIYGLLDNWKPGWKYSDTTSEFLLIQSRVKP